ncbi:MAG: hypothetical protein ACO3MW_09480 [Rhodospirillales bacterium]|jgi:hypothetical protein
MADRISMIDPETAQGMQKLYFDSARQMSGRLGHSHRIGAHVPFIQMMFSAFTAVVSREGGGGTLSTKIKEMVIIKTSHVNGCNY